MSRFCASFKSPVPLFLRFSLLTFPTSSSSTSSPYREIFFLPFATHGARFHFRSAAAAVIFPSSPSLNSFFLHSLFSFPLLSLVTPFHSLPCLVNRRHFLSSPFLCRWCVPPLRKVSSGAVRPASFAAAAARLDFSVAVSSVQCL